jgi:predicted SAM-dependent methyltransferase
LEWNDVREKDPIYLNLGGAEFHHPRPGYEKYISVDLDPPPGEWTVTHDLTTPIPLPDRSVSRIHTEDFLEHLAVERIESLLAECYRLLAPGGMMRIGLPDYNNPKDRHCLEIGHDERDPKHITLTHYGLVKGIIERSPFSHYEFYHYWVDGAYVDGAMDFSLGMIKRTPGNHPRCRRRGIIEITKGAARDLFYVLSHGFRMSRWELQTLKGRRLHVTSLTVDLFRD